jgi:hypothetical protein
LGNLFPKPPDIFSIDSLHGLGTIPTYSTVRAEATPDALQLAYDQMRVGSRPKPKSSP